MAPRMPDIECRDEKMPTAANTAAGCPWSVGILNLTATEVAMVRQFVQSLRMGRQPLDGNMAMLTRGLTDGLAEASQLATAMDGLATASQLAATPWGRNGDYGINPDDIDYSRGGDGPNVGPAYYKAVTSGEVGRPAPISRQSYMGLSAEARQQFMEAVLAMSPADREKYISRTQLMSLADLDGLELEDDIVRDAAKQPEPEEPKNRFSGLEFD